jgi:hypothetical protein
MLPYFTTIPLKALNRWGSSVSTQSRYIVICQHAKRYIYLAVVLEQKLAARNKFDRIQVAFHPEGLALKSHTIYYK